MLARKGVFKLETAKWLALCSLSIYLIAFGIYNWQMIHGKNKPNAAMWTLWVILSILNAVSYQIMTGDWVKSLITYGGCVAMATTFIIALKKGKFEKLSVFDKMSLFVGLVAVTSWWVMRDATFANILLQVCIGISFIPTYRGVWHHPQNERPLPWFLFSLGYSFQILVVVTRWSGQAQDLVYPINCLILHLVVAIIALRKTV